MPGTYRKDIDMNKYTLTIKYGDGCYDYEIEKGRNEAEAIKKYKDFRLAECKRENPGDGKRAIDVFNNAEVLKAEII